ncbi:MAG: cation:proton antiporter [Planctomycetia bacterium]|nr:cation:proton antiporter [Planctomycetia bacterium]
MSGTPFVTFAVGIALMLVCGIGCGYVMRRLHQPAVLGEMLGGIILGPTIFGALYPEWQAALFPSVGNVAAVRNGTIKLGMLFFLFTVGLEIDLRSLRRHGLSALLIGTIGTAVPLLVGTAVVYLLPSLFPVPDETLRLPLALFIGASLANSANPVLARILLDLGLMKDKLGTILMAATVVDDLVGWSLLAIVMGRAANGAAGSTAAAASAGQSSLWGGVATVFVFFLVTMALGRWFATPLLRRARRKLNWPSGFIGTAIVLVLVSAAASEHFGLHAFLGPFLLGIALAPTTAEREEAYGVMEHFVLSFFVPIYFVSMGLTSNFLTQFDLSVVLVILVTACVSKILSAYAAARLGGLDSRTSWAVGCGMNARGATGIILAGVGLESGVIDHRIYVALVLMALITSMMAGPLMKLFLAAHGATSESFKEAPLAGERPA